LVSLSSLLLRRNTADPPVSTIAVVIDPESRELSFEVKPVLEQHSVQRLFANGSHHAFNEWVRTRYQGHSLDLLDLQHAQTGSPAMEAK
jgi:hypothetical protein